MASVDTEQRTSCPAGLPCDNQDSFCFEDPSFYRCYTERQVALRKRKIFTDILLKSGELAIPCHRLALASASPYFYEKLSSGKFIGIMELQDVSPDVLELIIDYIYTSKVQITAGNVEGLLNASRTLHLPSLEGACDQYTADRVEPTNAMGLVIFAKDHNLDATKIAAMQCLLKQPDEVLKHASDAEIRLLDQDSLIEWISSDDLEVSDESLAFRLVERWVGVDEKSRMNEKCVSKVLSHVRLCHCPVAFLVKTVSKSHFLKYRVCKEQFDMAKTFALMKLAGEKSDDVNNVQTRPRRNQYKPHVVLIGGGTLGGVNNAQCWSLQEGRDTWHKLTQLPPEQANYTYDIRGCFIDSNIIITGGSMQKFGKSPTGNSWLYNTRSQQWKDLPSMQQARSMHGMVVVGQTVMVMGGWHDEDLSSVEVLDKTRSQWGVRTPMPYALCFCHAFNVEDKVYVFSGREQKTLQYDPAVDAWQEKKGMPTENSLCSMVNVNNCIYVTGGDLEMQNYCYDIKLDTWTQLSDPLGMHACPGAVNLGGTILLCGGWTDLGRSNIKAYIEAYDVEKDQWMEHEFSLPIRVASHCMVKAMLDPK